MSQVAPFIELQKRSNRISLIVGIVITLLGGALYMIPAKTPKDALIRFGIMGFFGLLGIALVVLGLKDPARAAAICALRDNPGEVVWIYVQRSLRNGQHVGSELKIGLLNGKTVSLPLGIGRETELQNLAHSIVPQAQVGFDPDLMIKFRSNPASLRRV